MSIQKKINKIQDLITEICQESFGGFSVSGWKKRNYNSIIVLCMKTIPMRIK